MNLTRRDALLVLVGGGVVGSAVLEDGLPREEEPTPSESTVRTLQAVADVLYPSAVSTSPEFVETYVVGRQRWQETYLDGVRSAIQDLGTASRRETGRSFEAIDSDLREDVLRSTGAHRAYSDPEGSTAQRVRYYLVDDLLYALYASPKGGELVGNDNPSGYPGGTEAYQQTPPGGRRDGS